MTRATVGVTSTTPSRPFKVIATDLRELISLALQCGLVGATLAILATPGIRIGRTWKRPQTEHKIKLELAELPESVKLPSIEIDLSISEVPKVDVGISELPKVDVGISELPKVDVGISELPKLEVALDPLEVKLTEFPSLRVHLPVNYRFGFCFLGYEVGGIRICGEAQVITEPYVPNRCERCDDRN